MAKQDLTLGVLITSAALSLDATLDDAGNFTGLISSGQSYEFVYDTLYRLTDLIQGSTLLEHFDYDATGNRTAANIGGAAQSYAYPANSHRLQSINGTSRDYDNAGNTTWSEGLNYRYSGRNRLSQVSMGRTTRYTATYNARGEREEKKLGIGLNVQRFVYDEAGRLIQTGNVPNTGLNRTLNPEQRLLWLDDQLVGVKLKTTSGTYPGELLYAHTDHLGTPRALSRSSNNSTVWRWPLETTAFGQHPAQTDPDGDGQALTFNLRYPGQYFDAESGLHYNYFRDSFDPALGRYGQPDPIGLKGGPSIYSYVDSSPLNSIDPSGLIKVEGCVGCEYRNVDEVKKSTEEWCDWAAQRNRIRDVAIRRCIQDNCRKGTISCKSDCRRRTVCGRDIGVPRGYFDPRESDTPVVCLNSVEPAGGWGSTAIHEIAHSCGWRHGQGGGVPNDPGPDVPCTP